MKKLIVLILVIVFAFIGIKLLKPEKETNVNSTIADTSYVSESDPGLVVPEQIKVSTAEKFFDYNGWVYYGVSDLNAKSIYKMKPDGSEKTLIYQGEEFAENLCVYDDYIYFGSYNICRVKTDGTDFKELYHMGISTECIMVMDDMVFFIDGTESNPYNYGTYICSINLDGSNYQRWTDEDGFSKFYLNGYDLYYYSKKIEGMKVFNLNTRTETVLSEITSAPVVIENKLIFANKTTRTLNEKDLNTGTQRQLYSVDGNFFVICGVYNNNIITMDGYNTNNGSKGKVYSSSIYAPENKTVIFSEDNTGMKHGDTQCLVGEWLYFVRISDYTGDDMWYALNLNTYETIPLEISF